MSFGDVMSLVAVALIIVFVVWTFDRDLRDAYRAARAAGAPRVVAVPAAFVLALLSGA